MGGGGKRVKMRRTEPDLEAKGEKKQLTKQQQKEKAEWMCSSTVEKTNGLRVEKPDGHRQQEPPQVFT